MLQKSKNVYHKAKSHLASAYFGNPSKKLKIIGVTGTDGKTTTASMLYKILKDSSRNVSVITSVNAQIGKKTFDTGFHVTTPNAWQVQKFLKQALDAGCKYFVLETTSHRLDQNVIAAIDFEIGIITNISQEHLDYHKTWENYAKAKAKLFRKSKVSVLNKDDKSFEILIKAAKNKIVTYSLKKSSDINPQNYKLNLKVPGNYNMYNALAAAAAAEELGVDKKIIIKSLNSYAGTKGRMEEIHQGQNYRVFVDFAHTANALKNALETLNKIKKRKLIAVFGSAGKRDVQKRKAMGKVASNFADFSVITAEDPRTEKVEDICGQIARGFGNKKNYIVETDRKKAIRLAISKTKKDDIVATFGKSHEKSMCWGKTEYPWDEFEAVKEAIEKKANK